MDELHNYIALNKQRFLKELLELIRIPSVSAQPEHNADMHEAAEWIRRNLIVSGVDRAEKYDTDGHPVVYAEKIIDKNLPTILVYGHYDVQPAEPLDLWDSPPFDPVVKETNIHPEGAIFARGACDDKGQMFMHIKAFEAMNSTGHLSCNVKFMIEGEEEVGSENLERFCVEHKEMLKCDVILVSDTSVLANDIPSITTGLRGLSYVEVEVTGPNRDLHSGVYGGGVANPINVLCEMVASLQDADHRITVDGFYDNVIDLSDSERKAVNSAPFDLEFYKKDLEVNDVRGESGYSTIERTSTRPTLDVNGIWGGYIGEGAKTVLPSKAFAKISMRLVPNQEPDQITDLFLKHFKNIAPEGVTVEIRPHHGGFPVVTPTDTAEYQAAHNAMKSSFGKDPIPVRGGGSIPIVALFEKVLEVKTVLMGFGLDSDSIHSPNEHFGLFNFYKGIETIPLYFSNYSMLKK